MFNLQIVLKWQKKQLQIIILIIIAHSESFRITKISKDLSHDCWEIFYFKIIIMFDIKKIKTIQNSDQGQIFYSLERWMITRRICNNNEIFYFDPKTYIDPTKSVRWWISVMFPRVGEVTSNFDQNKKLPRHGLARNMKRRLEKNSNFNFFCHSNDSTDAIYPFDRKINQVFELNQNTLHHKLQIKNTDITQIPFSAGIHPYFAIDSDKKVNIWRDCKYRSKIIEWYDIRSQGWTIVIPNPCNTKDEKFAVHFPDRTIELNICPAYKYIAIWSEKDKNFVCVEPMTTDILDHKFGYLRLNKTLELSTEITVRNILPKNPKYEKFCWN